MSDLALSQQIGMAKRKGEKARETRVITVKSEADGKTYTVWESTALEEFFNHVQRGMRVAITFHGLRDVGRPQPMKVFQGAFTDEDAAEFVDDENDDTPPPAKKAAAAKPAAKAAVPAKAVAADAGTQPKGLKAPKKGKADDLKTIEGVGPALEKLLNELGIFHFEQIAGWGEAEIAWIDGNLKGFKGRATRDKWVAQAKLIGEVGIEEFLIRAKTNNY